MKALLPLLLLSTSLAASAQIAGTTHNDYYRRPVQWQPADTLRDTVPSAFLGLNAHLRVKAPQGRPIDVSLLYDYTDAGHYRRCRLHRPAGPMGDELAAQPLWLEVWQVADGELKLLSQTEILKGLNPSDDTYSLKLLSGVNGAVAIVGQNSQLCRQPIPFDSDHGTEFLWVCDSQVGLIRRSLAFEKAEPARFSRFDSEEELADYLRESTDINEGYWIYFDRDNDPVRLAIGGDYRLATVHKLDAPGYEILYLSGARTNAEAWKPLQIKGQLIPSGFIDHYDLQWIDAYGRMHSRETSADITDSSTLTLYFPLLKSKIRYRRLQP